jgi:putative FmdB family regulatory protein
MPIFEYQCAECCTVFEKLVLQRQTTVPVPCVKCGSTSTTKVLSTFCTQSSGSAATASAGAPVFR